MEWWQQLAYMLLPVAVLTGAQISLLVFSWRLVERLRELVPTRPPCEHEWEVREWTSELDRVYQPSGATVKHQYGGWTRFCTRCGKLVEWSGAPAPKRWWQGP